MILTPYHVFSCKILLLSLLPIDASWLLLLLLLNDAYKNHKQLFSCSSLYYSSNWYQDSGLSIDLKLPLLLEIGVTLAMIEDDDAMVIKREKRQGKYNRGCRSETKQGEAEENGEKNRGKRWRVKTRWRMSRGKM